MSIPHLITRSVIIKDVKEEGGIFIPVILFFKWNLLIELMFL